jgi:hypothetical protein
MKLWAATLLVILPLESHAYVDPGTGAYLIQTLIALGAALAFWARNPGKLVKEMWDRLKSRFK